MKKSYLILTLLMTTSAMYSCGGGGDDPEPTPTPEDSEGGEDGEGL